jgi:hypothetical protein
VPKFLLPNSCVTQTLRYPNRLLPKFPHTQVSWCLIPVLLKLSGTQIVCYQNFLIPKFLLPNSCVTQTLRYPNRLLFKSSHTQISWCLSFCCLIPVTKTLQYPNRLLLKSPDTQISWCLNFYYLSPVLPKPSGKQIDDISCTMPVQSSISLSLCCPLLQN